MSRFIAMLISVMILFCGAGASATEGYTLRIENDIAFVRVTDDFFGDVIFASFDGDMLYDVTAFPDTVLLSTDEYEFSLENLGVTDSCSIKLFLWEPSMKPYTFFDDSMENYNTFSVDSVTGMYSASIIMEDDLSESCTAFLCDIDGDNISQSDVSIADGIMHISGAVGNPTEKYTLRIYDGDKVIRRYNLFDGKAPTNAHILRLSQSLEEKLAKLDEMLLKCEKAGLSTDYETMYRGVIGYFIQYFERDISEKDQRYTLYTYEKCMELYSRAMESLDAYLKGEKVPFDVPKYVTGKIENDGVTLIADTVYKGEKERRPVHFVGYNYLIEYENEIDNFAAIGSNHVQIDFGPSFMMKDPITWTVTKTEDTVTAEVAADKKRSGAKSFKIANTATNGSAVLSQTVQFEENKTYSIGFYALASGVTSAKLKVGNKSVSIPTTTLSRWKAISLKFDSMQTAQLSVQIEVTGKAGHLYIDDFYVTAQDGDLAVNGGFEEDLESEYRIDYKEANQYCKELSDAEEKNIAVDLAISCQYMPDYLKQKYPDAFEQGIDYSDERLRRIVKIWLDAFMPMVAEYDSLKSVCLMGEPRFYAANWGDRFKPEYVEFLRGKYGEISALNSAYGTAYTDFDAVSMPKHHNWTYTAHYRDYWEFNNTFLTDFHKFLAENIRKYTDVPFHSKIMWTMGSVDYDHDRDRWNLGVNHEKIAEYTEYNGNDNVYYLRDLRLGWYRDAMSKSITYDYQLGVQKTPVINSEDHIIPDNDFDLSDEQKKVNKTDLWQNALHGRSQSSLWAWGKPYYEKSILYMGLGARPDVMAELSAVGFDLNRLSWEIKALNEARAETAVLYSDTTRSYTNTHLNRVYDAYEALYFSGYKADIVIESKIAELDGNIKVLVLPNATHLSDETVEAIYTHMQNGIKIVILNGAPDFDENGKRRTSDKLAAIKNSASTFAYDTVRWPDIVDRDLVRADISEIADSVCENTLRLIDVSTGKAIDNTEYFCCYYDGKLLISLANYDYNFKDNPTVEVFLNGEKITGFTELISGKYIGDTVSIKPFEPMLLQTEAI